MAGNNTAEAQEPIKKAKAYKVTSKAFTKRRGSRRGSRGKNKGYYAGAHY